MLKQIFEGYGPGEAAVWVDCLTDGPRRIAAEVRAAFLRHGGRLGAPGSVGYLFREVGRLVIPADSRPEALIRLASEAGAEDVMTGRGGMAEVYTDPLELEAVRTTLERAGFTSALHELTRRTAVRVPLEGSAVEEMRALLGELRGVGGVQRIYTNAEAAGELLESV
ncbi:MAG: YebC/PmpR family DNA-binding transcriptional regulator [Steroidobacteraceae bacterium]